MPVDPDRVVSRCSAVNKNGKQCSKRTAKNGMCWIHLKAKEGLQVKKSTVPRAGEGLFYVGKEPKKKGEKLADYTGKKITKEEAERNDSKYIFQPTKTVYIDARKS
jgi:hypothetical protein